MACRCGLCRQRGVCDLVLEDTDVRKALRSGWLSLIAVIAVSANGRVVYAQGNDDGANETPTLCPYEITVHASIDGVFFQDVPMRRTDAIVSTTNHYAGFGNYPVSFGGRFVWIEPGGWYTCSQIVLPNGQTATTVRNVSPLEGTVVAAPPRNEELPPPTPSGGPGGDGSQYQWSPVANGTTICYVTDWYDTYGAYMHTDFDYCYWRGF